MPRRSVENHVSYQAAKKAKLAEQFAKGGISPPGKDKHKTLFPDVHIYVNGYTVPPAEELKNLIVGHGGTYSVFLDSTVTHMITNNLPDSKMKLLKKIKVVKPEWVMDSISNGKQLPCADYFAVNPLREERRLLCSTRSVDRTRLVSTEQVKSDTTNNVLGESSHKQTHNEQSETSNHGQSLGADIESFYNKSRLHFLSTMKMEFRNYVTTLRMESGQRFLGLEKLKNWCKDKYEINDAVDWNRSTDDHLDEPSLNVIMHLDMDCYFASVSRCGRPDLEGVPIVVTSSKLKGLQYGNLDSMADIACCSYEARSYGVKNGMTLGRALQICPNLVAVTYEFEKYRSVSKKLYEIAASYTLALEAVSCDEMYIDCTNILMEANCSPVDFAEHIRKEIKECTGCCASAGLGGNHILARLATRKAKPNGIFYLEPLMVKEFMRDVPLKDLPGIGHVLNIKLKEFHLHTCGELQTWQLSKLENEFGVHTGKRLHSNCRGLEFVIRKKGHADERKSVSSEINYGIRFTEFIEAEETLKKISEIVSSKLGELKGKCITLKLKVKSLDAPATSAKFLGHGICDSICRNSSLNKATSDPDVIAKVSTDLLRKSCILVNDLRGLGIMVTKLETGRQKLKTESITEYFNNPKSKGISLKVKENAHHEQLKFSAHAERHPVSDSRLLGANNAKWQRPAPQSFFQERLMNGSIGEEVDLRKLLRSHFDSFVSTRISCRQFKNTVMCILLNEVSQLNIANAISSLRELNRLGKTKMLAPEKRKWWTILLSKISRKVHEALSKAVGYSLSNSTLPSNF